MIKFPTEIKTVAVAGDWHANTKYAARAVYWAAKQGVDVILHTGDFGYDFTDGYLNDLNEQAERSNVIVMFVDGNHENFDWLFAQPVDEDGVRRLRERIWHLPRGFRWEWIGVKFLSLGGAHSVDRQDRVPGVSWWPQEWLNVRDLMTAIDGGLADVMITHDCPDGVDIPGLPQGVFPEIELRYANSHRQLLGMVVDAVRPAYLFHGHYHRNYVSFRGETVVCGLQCDGYEFHENMVVWNVQNLKRVDKEQKVV